MDYLKLIGILIIVLGFILKFDVIFSIIIAGLVTALVSGMSLMEFFTVLGEAFVNNRLVTLFILTLPIIGICETNGLKQQAVNLIKKIKGLTTGKFLSIYLFIRELAGFFSLRIGGHPQFIRPLVVPMAEASFIAENKDITEEDRESIKARSASMENLGNFFGQNTFLGSSGVLLMASTMESLNYNVDNSNIAKASIPIAIITLIVGVILNYLKDKKMSKKYRGER